MQEYSLHMTSILRGGDLFHLFCPVWWWECSSLAGLAACCGIALAPVNYVFPELWISLQPGNVFVAVSSFEDFNQVDTCFLDVFNGERVLSFELTLPSAWRSGDYRNRCITTSFGSLYDLPRGSTLRIADKQMASSHLGVLLFLVRVTLNWTTISMGGYEISFIQAHTSVIPTLTLLNECESQEVDDY